MKQKFSKLQYFWVAVCLLWIKTFLIYVFGFEINAENGTQWLLLFINPISSSLLIFTLAMFFSKKRHKLAILIGSLISSFTLYGNLLYYRFFSDFLTIPVLLQTSNVGDLGSSAAALIHVSDVFYFFDIIILIALAVYKREPMLQMDLKEKLSFVSLAVLLFFANVAIAQVERPQLLTRSFDRELLVKNIGIFNYHLYDLSLHSKSKAQRAFADGTEIDDIKKFVNSNYKPYDEDLFSIAKGKNVFMISLESMQNFVINETIEGQEITPFLNELIKESYYFENFYHQTEQGKTSDSEFIVDNSWFGRPSGAVFFTHAQNEYLALPKVLKENSYHPVVFHANNKSFWNRDIVYNSFGYETFFDINSYEVTEENSIGWGLKDIDFFKQSIPYLKELPQPFYSKFITLTNHFPFELGEEDKLVPEFNSNSRTLNRYFPTVRYLDEAVKVFFEEIKEAGLYENSIFILYGDHYGISSNHDRAMEMFLGKEITPFETVQLQRVPLIVHIPGHTDHKVIDTVGGQIDILPTLLHLLGIETKGSIRFGTDLFAPERESFAILRNGSFITDDYVYTRDHCYRKLDGSEVEVSYCEPNAEKAMEILKLSDRMINGDLLRFYK